MSLKRRLWLSLLIVSVGVAEVVYAVQIRTWHGRGSWTGDPPRKVFVTSWLASEMWVNPWFLLAGVSTLIIAIVTFFISARWTRRHRGQGS